MKVKKKEHTSRSGVLKTWLNEYPVLKDDDELRDIADDLLNLAGEIVDYYESLEKDRLWRFRRRNPYRNYGMAKRLRMQARRIVIVPCDNNTFIQHAGEMIVVRCEETKGHYGQHSGPVEINSALVSLTWPNHREDEDD